MKQYLTLLALYFLLSPFIFLEAADLGFTTENYKINIVISENGYVDITEEITVDFTERRRGITRDIPRSFKYEGKKQNLELSHITVAKYDHKVLREGNDNVIRIGNPDIYLTGRQLYVLSYRISGIFLYAKESFFNIFRVAPKSKSTNFSSASE